MSKDAHSNFHANLLAANQLADAQRVVVINCFHGATLNNVYFSSEPRGNPLDDSQAHVEEQEEPLGMFKHVHQWDHSRKRQKSETHAEEFVEEVRQPELPSVHMNFPNPSPVTFEPKATSINVVEPDMDETQLRMLLREEKEVYFRHTGGQLMENDPLFYFNDTWLPKLVRENKYRLIHFQYKPQELIIDRQSEIHHKCSPVNNPYAVVTYAQCTQCSMLLQYKGKRNPRKNDGNALTHVKRHEKKGYN
ncbi:hypothetical protein OGAPHI_005804 [Ogataea philodendri]|uniref:Uncharacterized protein n=1 Tax=Ogataea philodendri TaxID=1378263 RepID=A0A9P8NZQ4_9ASCO|nr:uncharacterized protein OGAPHI_005804 [Ogataea philodendri]KAH3662552.1 hypothetical protein OGAPHI_005804 [Ogataea philodendri]